MLDLYRITLLVGPNTPAKHDLATAILADNPDVLARPLQAPIDNVLSSIIIDHDKHKDLNGRPIDFPHFAADYEKFLRGQFGPGALGHIAVHNLLESGDFDIYDTILVPDLCNLDDALPFTLKFKPRELCFIYTDPTKFVINFKGSTTIALTSESDLQAQLSQIADELSPRAAEGAAGAPGSVSAESEAEPEPSLVRPHEEGSSS